MKLHLFCISAAMYIAVISPVLAQDTRTVTEPVIPPACVKLLAEKTGEVEKLPEQYEKTTDTARIQKALDTCKPGMAVELAPSGKSNAFLTGSLDLRAGVTLLIDKGITLYGSRNPKDYDPNPTATGNLVCGTISQTSTTFTPGQAPAARACKPLISVINVKNAAIMGDGIIDGRGDAVVMGHDYTWWQMARKAEPQQLRYYSIRTIMASHADGFILYRITLHNSANYHVSVSASDGFTAWAVHLQTPTVKGMDARNTDGIDPGSSRNITITRSWLDTGDDNIAVKTGVTHMSVLDNHFYDGHGMSIGSETNTGVSDLLVDGLSEDHTTSGIRIKSNAARGGLVHDLTYRNICMRDVPVPIAISPFYNNQTIEGFVDPNIPGNLIPDYKRITLENIVDTTPGDVLIAGKDAQHVTEVKLSNVVIRGITPHQVHSQYTQATTGPGEVNFTLTGTGVTSVAVAGRATQLPTCQSAFPPMQ